MSLTRRALLCKLIAAGALTVSGRTVLFAADETSAKWHDQLDRASTLLGRNFSLDMHTHPALFPIKDIPRSSNPRPYRGDDAFASRVVGMQQGQMWSGFFSPVVDAPILGMTPHGPGMVRPFDRGEAWREFERQIAVLDELVERNNVVKATTVAEVDAAHAAGRTAAIYACEGGDHIEDKPERVEAIYAAGVRSLQLYHVALNSLLKADGNRDVGLTAIGRETVQEMNRVGLLADLAHASFATTAAAAEISTQPILSTHSLVREGPGRGVNMSIDHAKVVAQTGGVIGVFGGVSGGPAGFVENILRVIDIVGVEHVGIGTDMDGTGNAPAAFDRYTLLPEITARLLAKGLNEQDLAKVIGGNVARVLEQVRPHA